MNLACFLFIIGIAPAYLNEETSQSIPIETQVNQTDVQAQEEKEVDPKQNQNRKCPNNDALVETLVFMRDFLFPTDNRNVDVNIIKDTLGTLIQRLNYTNADDSDIPETVQIRPKKEVLRSHVDENNPRNILTGIVSLEYQVPELKNSDCQTLYRAILNAINAAYIQMNTYCTESGRCKLSNENVAPPQISILPGPPQQNSHGDIVQNPRTNEELNNYIMALLGTYPQNTDIMTLLQNYRPNSASSNVNVNNHPNNEHTLGNLNHINVVPNGQTQDAKKSVLEIYTILDNPSGYTVSQDHSPALIASADRVPIKNASHNIMYGAGSIQPPGPMGTILVTQNITGSPSISSEDMRLNQNTPSTGSSIMNSHAGNNNIPLQGYQQGVSNVINRNVFNNPPNQATDNNVLHRPQNTFQFTNNPLDAYLNLQQNPQGGSIYAKNLLNYPQTKFTLQDYYNYYQNPLHLKPPVSNQFGIGYLPNQRNMFINPQLHQGISYNTPPGVNNMLQNLNNTVALQDLYRLTSMTNGPKLNIAPNKNGMIELTFTLQRPKTLQYNPVYYVKYILPYQTYLYNLQNLLQRRPYLRNNPAQLYQELLSVANMTESSQDLKDLEKHEITQLVATNGALVKAKVLGDGKDSIDAVITDEVQNILKLSSKLSAEAMLNATKLAVSNIEEAINNGSNKAVANETTIVNAPIADVLNRSVNSRTLGNPFISNPQFLQQAIRNYRYRSPYTGYRNVINPGMQANRQILFG